MNSLPLGTGCPLSRRVDVRGDMGWGVLMRNLRLVSMASKHCSGHYGCNIVTAVGSFAIQWTGNRRAKGDS